MDMQNACARILNEVDGALGCIVIDMQTNLPVAAKSHPGRALNANTVDLISVVSTNMFSGKLIGQFEQALDRPQGSAPSFVREVQMATENTNQFMAAIPGWDQGLLVLVTDKSVSLGLGWMAVHRGLELLGQPPRPPLPAAQGPAEAADWETSVQPQGDAAAQGQFDAGPHYSRQPDAGKTPSSSPSPSPPSPSPPAPSSPYAGEQRAPYAASGPLAAPPPQVAAQTAKPVPRREPYIGEAQPAREDLAPKRAEDAPAATQAPAMTETRYHRGAPRERKAAAASALASPSQYHRGTPVEEAGAAPAEAQPQARMTAATETAKTTQAEAQEMAQPKQDDPGPAKAATLGPRMNMFASRKRKGGKK